MDQLLFKINTFEGPLDLLLSLIKKNKVDITDIPISEILDQYIETVQNMQDSDLEVSSDFLVMAATLLQIKSKMLLPAEKEEIDEEDPREELVKRLLEYKKFKESVSYFKKHENRGYSMFFKVPDVIPLSKAEFNYEKLTVENLLNAFKNSFSKMERKLPPPKKSFNGIVGHEKVSLKEKVNKIWHNIFKKTKVKFKDIFKGIKSKPEAVASFLAILELIKLKKICIDSDNASTDDFTVYKTENTDEFNLDGIED